MFEAIQTLVVGTSVLALAAVAFLFAARRLPAAGRSYGYAAAVAAGAMAATYVAMTATESMAAGAGTDFARFVGYTVIWSVICTVVAGVAGVGRRLAAALLAVVVVRLWITYGSWQVEGTVGSALAIVPFALLLVAIYLLFGPFMRAVSSTSGERQLLYAKLRNLVVLGWLALVVTGLLGEAFGLTTDFVAIVASTYIEAVLLVGFGGIVVRSGRALAATAASGDLNPFMRDGTASGEGLEDRAGSPS
ncbi:bacteriorhodopsin [Natronobacterium lacisalsi]|uniref:bacteriorhodopsin n=1 Tax=Natronobacterium lacisalsi TaxID=229731 RepID=UPI001EE6B5DD|nr:bacteriorhodopsin [Halobiforma lacisalsi]